MENIDSHSHAKPFLSKKKAILFVAAIVAIISLVGLEAYLSSTSSALGNTYYVDASAGNDANAGTSAAAPWKTIARVEAQTLAPGDTVLFKRGETWKEQLDITTSGTSSNPITFGAYASGTNPLIDGSEFVTTWTQYPGLQNIWYTSWTSDPRQIWVNGIRGVEKATLGELSADGQWMWELSNLYVYSPSDPNQYYTNPGIEVPLRDRAIYANGADYIVVDGIDVTKTNGDGNILLHNGADNVTLKNLATTKAGGNGIIFTSDNAVIQNVLVKNNGQILLAGGPGQHGIYAGNYGGYAASNWLIEDSVFEDNLRAGFHTYLSDGGTFRRNITRNNGDWGVVISNINALQNVNVYYNVSYGNGIAGIEVEYLGFGTTANVFNNVSYGNNGKGIKLEYNDNALNGAITIRNNIFAENSQEDFYHTHGTAEYVTTNNLYYRSDSGYVFHSNTTDWTMSQLISHLNSTGNPDNNVAADPQFVNAPASDFNLLETSPAVDAGVSVGLTSDIVGTAVPQGDFPDIGAYELAGTPPPPPPPTDTTPPTVSITSPANGSNVSRRSTVNISASASDNVGVAFVEFYVNNSLVCTDNTAAYSCSWSVPGRKNANYTLTAVAEDPSGNRTTSAPVTVTAQ